MRAAHEGHSEAIKTLIERRADVAATDTLGVTALISAAQAGHSEAHETLKTYPEFLEQCSFFDKTLIFDKNAGSILGKLFKNCGDRKEVINRVKEIIENHQETKKHLLSKDTEEILIKDVMKIVIEHFAS